MYALAYSYGYTASCESWSRDSAVLLLQPPSFVRQKSLVTALLGRQSTSNGAGLPLSAVKTACRDLVFHTLCAIPG